ncbi:hypothetical protein GCM10010261_51380 [Streptomyces pilosus]|nr:hypothetical protein GCM10010261_51380 [Streptomyces pilosus]
MRAFSQPPCDSPLAAIEQNSANDSSWSRISWNRLRADSMVDHLSAGSRGAGLPQFRKEGVKCEEAGAATGGLDNCAERSTREGVTAGVRGCCRE